MSHEELRQAVRDLLTETGQAHHGAFAATDGEDPDWPIWYADHLQDRLCRLLDQPFTKSRLIYCLMFVEFERSARDPDSDWATYYAAHLVERFAAAEKPEQDRLALYYFPACPFCRLVLHAIDRLGIDVELRDIHENPAHRDELIGARGRSTVPVLRITDDEEQDRWMPESRDIVRYLEKSFG